MNAQAKFYDAIRTGLLGPTLDTGEVSGCAAILDAMAGAPLSYAAYALKFQAALAAGGWA